MKVISGEKFNSKNRDRLIKIMPSNMITHGGYQWKQGLNTDSVFLPDADEGGLYCCEGNDVCYWIPVLKGYSCFFEVQIPDEAQVVVFDAKIKSSHLTLGEELRCVGKNTYRPSFERISDIIERARLILEESGKPLSDLVFNQPLTDQVRKLINLSGVDGVDGILAIHDYPVKDTNVKTEICRKFDYSKLIKFGVSEDFLDYYARTCILKRYYIDPSPEFLTFIERKYGDLSDTEICLELWQCRWWSWNIIKIIQLLSKKIDPIKYGSLYIARDSRIESEDWELITRVNPGLCVWMDPCEMTKKIAKFISKAPESEFVSVKTLCRVELKRRVEKFGYRSPVFL